MTAAEITWSLVGLVALVLVTFCFLAVLWSRREWNSRKIRVGLFLEREYQGDVPSHSGNDAPTQEWPQRKE